jgi:hypothetical protein
MDEKDNTHRRDENVYKNMGQKISSLGINDRMALI